MKLNITHRASLVVTFLLFGIFALAQQSALDIAQQHVRKNLEQWGLTQQDIAGMTVNDMYTDKKTGISRVFFLQHHQGIPVYNAIMNVNITAGGKVFYTGKRFVPELSTKTNTTVPVMSAGQAIQNLATHLELPATDLRIIHQNGNHEFVFEQGDIAREPITARLSYQPYQGSALLAWDILLAPVGNYDKWSTRVDAVTGEVLDEYNWTIYCKVDGSAFSRGNHDCHAHQSDNKMVKNEFDLSLLGTGTYNVWPAPYESPSHGPRTLVEEPADPEASPFGWHDTDGADGPEYTITRGNNAHAYLDRMNAGTSQDDEPDGGADLIFDFDYDPAWDPAEYVETSVTNLFYWSNFMHDYSWRMGFDEAAGNFQHNTYGNGGAGNDPIIARAQAGADSGSANNAFYAHSTDGQSGSINMFIWTSGSYLTVEEPDSISGGYATILPTAGDWGAGAYVTNVPVSGEAIFVEDITNPATDGCQDLLNADDIAGKIALIDRGICQFGSKALRAQQAGAIGVVICNVDGGTALSGMLPGDDGSQVEIPVVMLEYLDCALIRQSAGNGLVITLVNPQSSALDGDLDNGIIAHEYGHGVSIRLTGGPSTSCLNNAEQMGEGWSDFISLVTSVQDGDNATLARGVGTYALAQNTSGVGIRRFPYSTDMNVNPLTYADVASNTEVHALGEVWTTVLWDMYWNFVDEYGWSSDFYNENSGNFKAVRLVYEGMKTQDCNPGFLTGRDAILAADEALYDGANYCLIWKSFARRGMGELAEQGSTGDATDQVEDFTQPCECRDKLSIRKSVTDFIEAGENIEVTLDVENCKVEAVTNAVVTDEIPNGTEYLAGSANIPATVQGNTIIFELGDMPFASAEKITYTLTTTDGNYSVRYFLDDVPDDLAEDNWDYSIAAGNILWSITDIGGYTGDFAWSAGNETPESETYLTLREDVAWTVTGDRPTLRIYHKYDTQGGDEGGLLEIREVGETEWNLLEDNMLRNGYPATLQYGTFAIPNLRSFTGYSGEEYEGTYIDLSEYAGQPIQIQFKYGSDDNTSGAGNGWLIDDIEFLDLFSYNGEACITTHEGDNVCVMAPEEGTIVESRELPPNSTVEELENVTIATYPNPVSQALNVAITSKEQTDLTLSLVTVDGKVVMERLHNAYGNSHVRMNISGIPAGLYFLKVSSEQGQLVRKVVIE